MNVLGLPNCKRGPKSFFTSGVVQHIIPLIEMCRYKGHGSEIYTQTEPKNFAEFPRGNTGFRANATVCVVTPFVTSPEFTWHILRFLPRTVEAIAQHSYNSCKLLYLNKSLAIRRSHIPGNRLTLWAHLPISLRNPFTEIPTCYKNTVKIPPSARTNKCFSMFQNYWDEIQSYRGVNKIPVTK